jgi:hypothetical protein
MNRANHRTQGPIGRAAIHRPARRSLALIGLIAAGLTAIIESPSAVAAPFDAVCPVVGIDRSETGLTEVLPADGSPAIATSIGTPSDVAVDTDGSVFYANPGQGAVFKVSPSGVITRFAGTGANVPPTNGTPANVTPLDIPTKLAIDRTRRRLYIGGSSGVYRIDLNTNIITRAVGNGTIGQPVLGAVATASPFTATTGFDVAASGELFVALPIATNGTDVLRIPDGTGVITRYAGQGSQTSLPVDGPRATTPLPFVNDITITNTGTVYLLTDFNLISITPLTVSRLNPDAFAGVVGDGPLAGLRLHRARSLAYDTAANSLYVVGGDKGGSFLGSTVRRIDLNSPTLPTTTYAGTDVQGTGLIGDNLQRTDPNVHFFGMTGVAVGTDGSVVIADAGHDRIRRIASGAAGIVSTIAGNAPVAGAGIGTNPTDVVFGAPGKVAVDPTGNSYVSDLAARRVWKVAPNGSTTVFAGNGQTQDIFTTQLEGVATQVPIGAPGSIAVGPDGSVFIGANSEAFSGLRSSNVVKVDPAGNLTRVYGTGNAGYSPAADGSIARDVGTGFAADLAVDSAGTLYVGELNPGVVRRIGADGILRTFADLTTDPAIELPANALAFDSDGNLFVGSNGGVYRVDGRTGAVVRVVGSGEILPIGASNGFGGPAISANILTVQGLALNDRGGLFLVDDVTVMQVSPTGTGASGYANAPIVRLAGGLVDGLTTGGLAINTQTRPRDVAFNEATQNLIYPEFTFGGGAYLYSRQLREIASNGCASLRLTSSAGSILATGNGTALADLPASQLPRGGGIYALAKLRSTDLSASATQVSPLSSIPLSSIPLSSIPLSSIPLSSIPLSSIGGWQTLLVGTIFEGRPLQNVTLGQVKELANVRAIQLGQIDLRNSPLSSISIAGIALGSAPLSSIPLSSIGTQAPLDQWCAALATAGFDCVINGVDATTTLIDLELKAAPLSSIPLSSIPLSSIPLSSIPLSSIPLSSIPLSSIPLSSVPLSSITITGTPLSSIPLSSIPLSSINNVVNCGLVNCATATFQQALNAGAFRPGAKLGDIVSALSGFSVGQLVPSLPASVTLEDLLVGLVARPDLPWEAASLEQIGLTTAGTVGGSTATYRANFRLFADRPAGATSVTITMPPGFTYRAASGLLSAQPPGGVLISSPIEPTISGQSLTFQAPASTVAPSEVSVEFGLRTGTGTGASTLDASVSPVTANASPANASLGQRG